MNDNTFNAQKILYTPSKIMDYLADYFDSMYDIVRKENRYQCTPMMLDMLDDVINHLRELRSETKMKNLSQTITHIIERTKENEKALQDINENDTDI